MKHSFGRIIIGAILILGGGFVLLAQLGYLPENVNAIWAAILLVSGTAFLGWYAHDRRHWWAVIPGLSLIGLGAMGLVPLETAYLAGAIFLFALGLAFWLIYAFGTGRWWAIIPGGTLFTLSAVCVALYRMGQVILGFTLNEWMISSLFFAGMALTFLLVAVLPKPQGMMKWAFIPALVLLLMSFTAASVQMQQVMLIVWPAALILVGIYLIYLFYKGRKS